MSKAEKKPFVFISYSSKDSRFVKKLANDIRQAGIALWFDADEIAIGDSVIGQLARGLAACTHLIIVVSREFATSQWCKAELRAVLHRAIQTGTKKVLPVVVSDIPQSLWDEPPFIFTAELHHLDLSSHSYKDNLPHLLTALREPSSIPSATQSVVSIHEKIDRFLSIENLRTLRFISHGNMHTMRCSEIVAADDESGDDSLAFITEEQVHFRNYHCGLSLNFTIRNNCPNELIIFSIEPELLRFLEADSSEFETIIANLPAVEGGWLSAPIFTHALFVYLSKDAHNCTSMFGSTDDSAGSRGIISPFNSFREVDSAERERFTKVLEKIDQYSELRKQVEPESIRAPVLENCIPQGRRFLLKPDESDSFHCQVTGNEPGIYFFRFKVAFHYESKKAVCYSDQVYPCFAGIGFLASAISE